MNLATKSKLIDDTVNAIKSENPEQIKSVQHILKTICHRQKESWLLFIINEVAPALNPKYADFDCEYCEQKFYNTQGLMSHLGKRHFDKKSEWSKAVHK